MLIKNIFMELRSRLRSCNVFITTSVDFGTNCNLRVSIQADSIVLHYYLLDDEDGYVDSRRDSLSSVESLSDCCSEDDSDSDVTEVIPIDAFCRVIPNSMSGLKIDRNNISFRILTQPKHGGNFYKELISANNNLKNVNESSHSSKMELKVGEEIKIVCANCMNVISDSTVKFDRILAMPSENLDMSEWFCHNHGNTSNEAIVLKSNKYDLLYRLCYFVVNLSILSEKTNKFNAKREVYHCNRCLAWLGLKSKDTVKLFNSTIKITRQDIEATVLTYKSSTNIDNICLNDFVYTIEAITKEFSIGFQYAIMCKIVLECNVSAETKQFLLIWIMDKELQVLRNSDELIVADNEDEIKLVSTYLTKILYKVETSMNEEVEMWMSDPNIVSSEISKNMFQNGVEHLRNMSLKVPESFRTTNGYFVSYLKV